MCLNRGGKVLKVAIITFHWATNYGAVLQSYALQNILQRLGVDKVRIIDYYPKHYKKYRFFIKQTLKSIIRFDPKGIVRGLICISKETKIEHFRKDNLMRTQYFCSDKVLKNRLEHYDVYFCGSDQIWNISFTENGEGRGKNTYTYYLDFAPNDAVKASYAASFGETEYKTKLIASIKQCLDRFDFISVREKTGVEILKKMNIDNAEIVPDPTLLLEKREYERFVKNESILGKYAFVYILHGKDNDAKSLVEKLHQDGYNILKSGDEGVEEWLTYIYNAECVLTNSFHGIVFSIIFERPFVAFFVSGSGMNDRIITLLGELGLGNRIFDGDISIINNEIDWDSVKDKLNRYRKGGIDYLIRVLESGKQNKE